MYLMKFVSLSKHQSEARQFSSRTHQHFAKDFFSSRAMAAIPKNEKVTLTHSVYSYVMTTSDVRKSS